MLSLPEISRVTGIPMPIILRIKREHPDEVPSVGSGSQQSFPAGVLEILRRIYREENSEGVPHEGRRVLFSLPRRRKERVVRPPTAEAPAGRPSAPPAEPEFVAAALSLAERLLRLEEGQRELAVLVRRTISDLQRPYQGTASAR